MNYVQLYMNNVHYVKTKLHALLAGVWGRVLLWFFCGGKWDCGAFTCRPARQHSGVNRLPEAKGPI